LEPCPFCGREPRYILEGPHHEQETHIFCVCPVEPLVLVEGANNLAAAAEIWNRRVCVKCDLARVIFGELSEPELLTEGAEQVLRSRLWELYK